MLMLTAAPRQGQTMAALIDNPVALTICLDDIPV